MSERDALAGAPKTPCGKGVTAVTDMPISLSDLPPPPEGRTGWPWTEASSVQLSEAERARQWPLISIVTPSFNQGEFIEETIRSVLLQGYPNLEYVITDGGSTDQSVEIIKKYAPWLKHWSSESDEGITDALSKGFACSSGEVYGWMGTDDLFLKDGIWKIMRVREDNLDAVAWAGTSHTIARDGSFMCLRAPKVGDKHAFSCWGTDAFIDQPACLFSAEAFEKAGKFNLRFPMFMDVDLWMRLSDIGRIVATQEEIACTRMHAEMGSADLYGRETMVIALGTYNGAYKSARRELQLFVERSRRRYVERAERFDAIDTDYVLFLKYALVRTRKAFLQLFDKK
jgi:glycosyltransferase involved in cell wall biosynthesis